MPTDLSSLRSHGGKVLQEVGTMVKLSAEHKDNELTGRIEKVKLMIKNKAFIILIVNNFQLVKNHEPRNVGVPQIKVLVIPNYLL